MTDQIKYGVLDEVILNTDDFIATVPKSQRKSSANSLQHHPLQNLWQRFLT